MSIPSGARGPVISLRRPKLDHPALIVSWTDDTGGLADGVCGYLNRRLNHEPFCEIDPGEFFPLDGVAIENDVVQFPGCSFFAGSREDLAICAGSPPRFDWYRFLNLILDVAIEQCQVSEIYAIGSMASLAAHTTPREILANLNSEKMKDSLVGYNLNTTLNYETPAGQRPTLNSFLLWAAQRRNVPAATLWVPIPFYMTGGDPRAQLRMLEFFNRRLNLCMDFGDIDEEIRQQDRVIAEARRRSGELDESIKKLESGETLSPEESERLAEEMDRSFRARKRS